MLDQTKIDVKLLNRCKRDSLFETESLIYSKNITNHKDPKNIKIFDLKKINNDYARENNQLFSSFNLVTSTRKTKSKNGMRSFFSFNKN